MKTTIVSIVIAAALIAGALIFSTQGEKSGTVRNVNNVTVKNGTQIVEVEARGGYFPRKSLATAGLPTVLRFRTAGTFDCSSSVIIPSMNLARTLPQSGYLDIDLGAREPGTLRGSCGMGMYPFEIEFKRR